MNSLRQPSLDQAHRARALLGRAREKLYAYPVLLDVVMLRREGRRRLKNELLAEMPIRGEVTIGGRGIDGLTATLERADMPGSPCRKLLTVRLVRMHESHLVISGIEELPDARGGLRHQQAWWCRLPAGAQPRPFDPNPPSAVRRDPSYVR